MKKAIASIFLDFVRYRFIFQFARVALIDERLTSGCLGVVTLACSSQHSQRAQGVVSYTVVWGGVEIEQPVVVTWDDSELITLNSLLKCVIHEPHSSGIVVFLLKLCPNVFKSQYPRTFPLKIHAACKRSNNLHIERSVRNERWKVKSALFKSSASLNRIRCCQWWKQFFWRNCKYDIPYQKFGRCRPSIYLNLMLHGKIRIDGLLEQCCNHSSKQCCNAVLR